ncbi:aminoglycoside phosphotransferase [Geobacillus genomosp. 3]|uniref:Aminoglycoside phosphotransferase n=1 Tax=Geobacillus genomosp. 3 TaxID=1921421 RepID=S5ZR88_GEOG3|nr:phosphotransferase [Geobacillus genomosp. 3]AGT32933.1 aminoglycoside phosphotransferase [Geobacillus genomosp. 3]
MARSSNQTERDAARRLFFLLNRHCRLAIRQAVMLKPHVIAIVTWHGSFIAKAYRSLAAARRQAWLLGTLRRAGFFAAPAVVPIGHGGVITAGGRYWLLTEYVADARPLSFANEPDISDGLQVLNGYHLATARIVYGEQASMWLPSVQLYEKWRRRYDEFFRHLPFIETVMEKEDISFTLRWAHYCLETCREHAQELAAESVAIIHGDVAAHNFLRTAAGHVYMIDYDTAALASPGLDYWQYANRILPHLDWSYSALTRFAPLRRWLEKHWFLHALLFPADVFREWRPAVARRRPLALDREKRERFVRRLCAMLK